ncbi:MAG TPA: sialidase family protein [Blastocatellia bacterium]|nr:sialidase family protein [Blastocatellia bacterium]
MNGQVNIFSKAMILLLAFGASILGVQMPGQSKSLVGDDSQRPALINVGKNVLVSAVMSSTPHVEPCIAVDPLDASHLVSASIAATGSDRLFTVVTYCSFDGGETWNLGNLSALDDMRFEFAMDPWVAFGLHGPVFLSCIVSDRNGKTTALFVFKSSDGGRTWDTPTQVPLGEGGPYDRPVLEVDRTRGSHPGNVYVAGGQNHVDELHENLFQPSASRSTDQGKSFSNPVWIRGTNLIANVNNIAMFDDGSIILSYTDYASSDFHRVDTPRVWTSLSTDRGLTFSPPHFVTEFHVAPPARFKYPAPLQEVAIDRSDGPFRNRVYAVWTNYEDDGTDIRVAYSNDLGLIWSKPVKINDNKNKCDEALPVIAINASGVLGISWMDRRASPNNDCYEVYFSASTDGGKSFLPNTKVSTALSCPRSVTASQSEQQSGLTVSSRWPVGGDYAGLAASPNGRFHLCWSDTRTGVFQLWTASAEVGSARPAQSTRGRS